MCYDRWQKLYDTKLRFIVQSSRLFAISCIFLSPFFCQSIINMSQHSITYSTDSTSQHHLPTAIHPSDHQVALTDLLNITGDTKAFECSSTSGETDLAHNALFAQPRVTKALTLMVQLHTHHCQLFSLTHDHKKSDNIHMQTSVQTNAHTLLLGKHGMGKTAFIKAWLQAHAGNCQPLPFLCFVDTQSPFAIHHLFISTKTHSSLQQSLDKFWQNVSAYLSQINADNDQSAYQNSNITIFDDIHTLTELLPLPAWQAYMKRLQNHLQKLSTPSYSIQISTEQIKQRFCIYLSPPVTAIDNLPPIKCVLQATPLSVLGGMILPNEYHHLDTQYHAVSSDLQYWQLGKAIQAQGGFLLIRLADLLAQPTLRQSLYEMLTTGHLSISYHTDTQQPLAYHAHTPPLPICLTLIAIGEAEEVEQLNDMHTNFANLFTVRAEFDDAVAPTMTHKNAFTQLIYHQLSLLNQYPDLVNRTDSPSSLISANAIWQIYRHFVRLSGHNYLQVHFGKLQQLIHASWVSAQYDKNSHHDDIDVNNIDANNIHRVIHHADHKKPLQIQATDVIQTIKAQQSQSDYLKTLYWQDIIQGQQNLTTQEWQIGRINALTVMDYADTQFGMPIQLTAVIEPHLGHGDIIDIEREVALGGDLHAKGMLIMSHFLKSTFSPFCPLNFSAALAMEQNYGEIDGDSATLAQACALLSALAQVDIYQGIAVTGSMNQLGEIQAVGGINDKIESFFDLCQHQSVMTNQQQHITQGVIIPKSNVIDLMLDDRVIKAVSSGQFAVYAINHISQAMNLLTNMPYHRTTKKGKISKHCVQGRIIKRLKQWQINDEA